MGKTIVVNPRCACAARVTVVYPRRACAARVTVLGSMCLSVCLCVKSHLTYGASVRPENAVTTQRTTKVKKFVWICLKLLRSRVMLRNMSEKANMLIIPTYPQSAFSALLETQQSARGYPTIVNNIQYAPLTCSKHRGFCTLVLFIEKVLV